MSDLTEPVDETETEAAVSIPGTVSIGTALWQNPLVGLEPRRTAATAVILGCFSLLFAVSHAGGVVTVGGQPIDTTTTLFDSLSAFVIVFAVALIVAGPIGYAVWNGGPVGAVVVALAPVVLGEMATGRYALGLDGAMAMTTGVVGCVLGLYVVDVRETATLRPWRVRTCSREQLLLVTAIALIGVASVARFVSSAPDLLWGIYAPFAVLWLVPMGVLGRYWLAHARGTDSSRSTGAGSDAS
ncbi:hypothetical protein [Natronosalvus vescus]|uniref:hypothetical protein n=1 Tax=Natronosalvus vescus TaxID=2953881 RepID=UPI0020911A61|nr:hypothetical protein [Natronosalvus vescus]